MISPSIEPFNEAKYKALMDGLECSEIMLSQTRQYEPFRIDSHFYEKQYQKLKLVLSRIPCFSLKELVIKSIQTGHTPSMAVNSYYGGSIALIKTDNLHDNSISTTFSDYLTEKGNSIISRTELADKDIVTTIIGATERIIARSAIVTKELLPANINQNIVQIRIDHEKVAPEYVNTYLNTKFGKGYLIYLSRQTEQFNLNCKEIETVLIPILSGKFQKEVVSAVVKAQEYQTKARLQYEKVENDLATSLNAQIQTQNQPVLSVKHISESFAVSGRLDAEYYQPKYDSLFDALSKFKTQKLGGAHGLVSIAKSIEPGSEAYVEDGIPFIRVSDVSKFEVSEPEIRLRSDILPNPEVLFPQKDTILLSKDGSVGIAYKVEATMSVITSGALLHLTVRDKSEVLPDYLTLVLNSPVVQLQAERDSNGAIIQHWKPSEIENVIIPVLDMDVQKEIATKVQESFALRKQSKQLLKYAKQAVEMAIEQGEDVALEWLKDKVN